MLSQQVGEGILMQSKIEGIADHLVWWWRVRSTALVAEGSDAICDPGDSAYLAWRLPACPVVECAAGKKNFA
jgi:hypothetical protein